MGDEDEEEEGEGVPPERVLVVAQSDAWVDRAVQFMEQESAAPATRVRRQDLFRKVQVRA